MTILGTAAAALIVAAISFAGCDSAPEGVITMTTATEGEVDILLAGIRTAVIDWGDGSAPEAVTLSPPDEDARLTGYSHTFFDTTSRTIVIKGQNITHLACGRLQLTAIDVSNNTGLTELDCGDNLLTGLDVTKNTALTYLACYNNPLTSLNVSNNTALTELQCNANRLTSLDVSKNTALTYLYCNNNQLTSLDITNNTGLTALSCYVNMLPALDVSKNTALTELICGDNRLTNLDVSKNTALIFLHCDYNRLTAEGLIALFGTLHGNAGFKEIHIGGNPGAEGCDQSIAAAKGWEALD